MKFSYNWLKELSGVNWSAEVLAERFAELGFPVAEIKNTGVTIKNIVSAKILSVEKHPNADKLSVTQIDDGSTQRTVVCGANNIAPGQVVPLAKPGTKFPNGLEIAIAKLRGVESQGMLCSERELGISDSHAGIMQLPTDTKLGIEISQILGSDTIFDLEIPPNRPDVLSHVGLAREIAALAGKKLKIPTLSWKAATKGEACKIENREPKLCSRYLGKLIHGVKIAPSPSWLSKRLAACGIRPINNVVDITNYVLLEYGHPLHAFDLAKLQGQQILIRRAKEGEKIDALDGKAYTLNNEDLVIADSERPVAIAGIMGGQLTGVTDETTDILLESAVFNPSNVRTTSSRLGLKSESSLRFEKGTDVVTAQYASVRAAQLILELAGGKSGRAQDSFPKKFIPKKIEIQLPRMKSAIGAEIREANMDRILVGLGYKVSKEKNKWKLEAPAHRHDVTEEADVTEDVLRFFGYNNIPAKLGAFRPGEVPPSFAYQEHKTLTDALKSFGFNETLTSSMSSIPLSKDFDVQESQMVRLANPLSQEESVLRPLLLPNLVRAVQRNVNHQRESVFLFEVGTRHALENNQPVEEQAVAFIAYGAQNPLSWKLSKEDVDFFFLKGTVEKLRQIFCGDCTLRIEQAKPFLHPHQSFSVVKNGAVVGVGGVLHPEIAKRYDLKRPVVVCEMQLKSEKPAVATFKEFSKYPFVERDIAIVVGSDVSWSKLSDVISQAGGTLLKSATPFDIFTGGSLETGKKSIAFRCHLQEDRTLLESDINKTIDRIKSALAERCGAQLR